MSEIKKLDEEQLEQVAGGKYDPQYPEIFQDEIFQFQEIFEDGVDPNDFEAELKMKDPYFPEIPSKEQGFRLRVIGESDGSL